MTTPLFSEYFVSMEESQVLVEASLPSLPRPATLAAGVAALLLSLLGVSGNMVTILSLARDPRLRSQATTLFVISLAVSDLLFCAVSLPITALRYFQQAWTLGPALCKLHPFVFYGSYGASLMSMVAIAINRWVLIAHFGVYHAIYRPAVIFATVSGVWLFSFGWLLLPLLSLWGTLGEEPATFTCTILRDAQGRSPKVFLFVLGFSLPCLAITTCYTAILLHVRAKGQAVARSTRTAAPLASSSKSSTASCQRREELQLTRTMMTIFLVFLLTFLPAMLANVLEGRLALPSLHLLASVLSWTSGAVNPLVYSLLNTRYKQAFRRTLCMAKVCGSSVSLTSSPSEESGLSFLPGSKVAPHPVQLQSLHTLSLLASRPCLPLPTSVLPNRGPRLEAMGGTDFTIITPE